MSLLHWGINNFTETRHRPERPWGKPGFCQTVFAKIGYKDISLERAQDLRTTE